MQGGVSIQQKREPATRGGDGSPAPPSLESTSPSFADLYDRYHRPVMRYLRARTRDQATAEDLAAQVFLKAFSASDQFRREGTYKSWLFQIARNTLLNHRMAKASSQIPVEKVPEESDQEDSPSVVALAREESDLIWGAVEELPDAQREVVRLRYLKDLSVDEIASFTGRTSGSIRVLLHRSIRSLRKRLNAKDLTVILGATGAAASVAIYSVHRQRRRNP